jgi:predicted TIM-barrel fold metal-dependent hydrolase
VQTPPGTLRIDAHVHLVGTGSHGSGCWYPRQGRYRWMVPLLAWSFGMRRRRPLRGDFDARYVHRLLRYVRESSFDAVVLLAMDAPRDERGALLHDADSFYVPNATVLDLAQEHRELLSGVSIHPARPEAEEELARALDRGAALLKLIPSCQNIDLSLPRYRPFWERCAAAGLPLLIHTGREPALQELRPDWGHPSILRGPLDCGATVIAAHCGGIYQREFLELLREYPRLFGDTAAFNVPFGTKSFSSLLEPEIVGRLIHGSDLPAPVAAWGHVWQRRMSVRTGWKLGRIANPLERDWQLKRALGFPEALRTRAGALLRLQPPSREKTMCTLNAGVHAPASRSR